mmetsp:Transcript_14898/g.22325  ORF Transcript_14898/g.22325 Transcript_14898/m.22325 type:complete len:341 (+) Transcript_14898:98-1120(+)
MDLASDKKIWTFKSLMQDHVRFVINVPLFFISPFILRPKQRLCIHKGVINQNRCTLSTNLHYELGRLAELYEENNDSMSIKDRYEFADFIEFGDVFAKYNGRGDEVKSAFDSIKAKYSFIIAQCSLSTALYMHWETLLGNTIDSFFRSTCRGLKKEGSSAVFEALFSIFLGPSMFALAVTMVMLATFKGTVPVVLNKIIGSLISLMASFSIVPVGIIGLISLQFIQLPGGGHHEPLPSSFDYAPIPEALSPNKFAVFLQKEFTRKRLGITISTDDNDSLIVSKLDPSSPIRSGTLLREGDKIVSINGVTLEGLTALQVAKLIRKSKGEIRVDALKTNSTA